MRYWYALCGVAVVAALGGCAGKAPDPTPQAGGVSMPATPPAWHEPTAYAFTLRSSCGDQRLKGTFRTVVQNGLVVQDTALDATARAKVPAGQLSRLVPTLAQIEATVASARKQGADEVVVDHDDTDGHPTSVRIDMRKDTRGDESCYDISNYSAG